MKLYIALVVILVVVTAFLDTRRYVQTDDTGYHGVPVSVGNHNPQQPVNHLELQGGE